MAVKSLHTIYEDRNIETSIDENTLTAGETNAGVFGVFKLFEGVKKALNNITTISGNKTFSGNVTIKNGTYRSSTNGIYASILPNGLLLVGLDAPVINLTANNTFEIGTLPEGFRPSRAMWFRCSAFIGTGYSYKEDGYVIIYVNTNGRVVGSSNVSGNHQIIGFGIN